MAILDDHRRTAFPAAPWEGLGLRLDGMARSAAGWLGRRAATRRARAALHAMTDAELADVGLTRAAIETALRHGRRGVGL